MEKTTRDKVKHQPSHFTTRDEQISHHDGERQKWPSVCTNSHYSRGNIPFQWSNLNFCEAQIFFASKIKLKFRISEALKVRVNVFKTDQVGFGIWPEVTTEWTSRDKPLRTMGLCLSMGLVFGSTKGTVLVGSKNPLLPVFSTPFHSPGSGGFSGLKYEIKWSQLVKIFLNPL